MCFRPMIHSTQRGQVLQQDSCLCPKSQSVYLHDTCIIGESHVPGDDRELLAREVCTDDDKPKA
jgi:hypothetical protein